MNFFTAVFPEKNFLENLHKKGTFGVLILYAFWSEISLKHSVLKSRLYMPNNCGVSKKSKTF